MLSFAEAPFLAGFVLAWSLAAPPGPANALIAQDAARRGWGAGWWTGLGAMAGDFCMFLLMWVGVLALVSRVAWLEPALGFAGAALLAWFAWGAWRGARHPKEAPEASGRGSFHRSFVIVVTSPMNWAWWIGAGSSMIADLGLVVFLGFFLGIFAWTGFWSGLAHAGATRIPRFAAGVGYASAVVLAAFAAYLAWRSALAASALLAA